MYVYGPGFISSKLVSNLVFDDKNGGCLVGELVTPIGFKTS